MGARLRIIAVDILGFGCFLRTAEEEGCSELTGGASEAKARLNEGPTRSRNYRNGHEEETVLNTFGAS